MMTKRYVAAIAFTTALAFIAPIGVNAASVTTSTVSASVGDINFSSSKTSVSGDNIKFAQVLSSNYNRNVSAQDIIRLRADFDFGLGDISLIYATAVYSGHTIDEISLLRHKNMGWGEIAKLYGVKVKDLKQSNYNVISAARGQGIEVNYIEINDDNDNRNSNDNRDDRNGHKKSYDKRDEKHDNGKNHGNKK